MVGQATLSRGLASILGDANVLPSGRTGEFAVDGLIPEAVALPASAEQVAAVLRLARGEGLAVIPWGGGTMMHIGNVPARYDLALALARLNQVLEHEPADLTVTCQAGIILADLQGHLARSGQFLPLDPPRGDVATIGGILAANASGPSRHAYGSARDLVIGMRVVTADGRITKAGGKVVKNVAGYDLCKLYIGSMGTLGVIVEATFKVMPLPKAQAWASVSFQTAAEACRYAQALHRRGLSLRAVELLNAAAVTGAGLETASPYVVALWLAGSPAGVQRSLGEARELALAASASYAEGEHSDDLWGRLRSLASGQGVELLGKASLLPSKLPELLSLIEGLASKPLLLARPTVGLVYAAWPALSPVEGSALANPASLLADLRALVANLGGSLVVEACLPDLKGEIDVFGEALPLPAGRRGAGRQGRSDFALMRRIKEHLDPKGILNPGRFLGRL